MYARLLLTAWASVMTIAFLVSVMSPAPEKVDTEKDAAFQQCLADITNKCGSIISYAVALESENAKLNSALKESKNKCTVIH